MITRRDFLSLAVASAAAISRVGLARGAAPSVRLETLFDSFRRAPGLFARFREDRTIALLVAPLRSEGTIHYDPRFGLARHTLSPSRSSVFLHDGRITLWDGRRVQVVALDGDRGLRAFVDSFEHLVAGNLKALQDSFRIDLSSSGSGFRLALTPLDEGVHRHIESIEMEGERSILRTLRVKEANGDASVTTFSNVDTSRHYSEQEGRTLFAPPAEGSGP